MAKFLGKFSFITLAVFTAFFPLMASATTITDGFDQPSSTQISAASNHKFTITVANNIALGDTMSFVFPAGFGLSTIIEDDVDFADDGVELTTAPDCSGTEQASAAVTSQTLTLTICPGDGGAIALGSIVVVKIGTNASSSGLGTHQITNPSTATSYFVNIAGTSGNSGTIILATTTAGSASVSATVPAPSGGGGGGGGGSTPPPVETPPAETPPAETPPAEIPPVEPPPAETPPAEVPPAETPPTEAPPTETPPTGGSPSPTNTGTGAPSGGSGSAPSSAPSGDSSGGNAPSEPIVPPPEIPPAVETPTEPIPPAAEPEVSPQVAQTIATLPTVLQAPVIQIVKTFSQVSRIIAQVSLFAEEFFEPLAVIQALPEVKATVDVAIPLTVAAAATTTVILASSFSLLPYLQFLFTSPLLFIARRKRKAFGVIYHSLSKVAIDLATVRLYDAVTNRLVRSIVTDAQGKYCLVVNPGQYRMVVAKHGFVFPSAVLKDVKDDGPYLDVYTGQYITVSDKDATIGVNVPLDPVEASSAVTLRKINVKKILRRLQRLLSVSGVVLSVFVWVLAPSSVTTMLAMVQMVVFLLFWRLAQPKKPKGWGIVYDATNKVPVGNAVVRLFEPAYNKLVETVLTDSLGRYSFLVGPNQYFVRTNKEGYDENIVRPIDYRTKTEPDAIAIDVPLTPTKPL